MTAAPLTQWQRLLKNQGTWVGSFTQLAPSGAVLQDTPSEVALLPLNQGNTMRQTIRKLPPVSRLAKRCLNIAPSGAGCCFVRRGPFPRGRFSAAR